jgi:hypothetical protein
MVAARLEPSRRRERRGSQENNGSYLGFLRSLLLSFVAQPVSAPVKITAYLNARWASGGHLLWNKMVPPTNLRVQNTRCGGDRTIGEAFTR